MTTASTILCPDSPAWRILPPGAAAPVNLPIPDDATPSQIASAVSALLSRHNYRGEGVLLALPSAWCLAATVSFAGVEADDRAALAFRLEEQLPIAAESFTADFVHSADQESTAALGVAVLNDRVADLIAALESAGIPIQSVMPAAMLALEACLPRVSKLLALRNPARASAAPIQSDAESPSLTRPPTDGAAIVILPDSADRISLFSITAGRPTAWITSEGDAASLNLNLDLLRLDLPPNIPILTCGLSTAPKAFAHNTPDDLSSDFNTEDLELAANDSGLSSTEFAEVGTHDSALTPTNSGLRTQDTALSFDPAVTPQDFPKLIRDHAHELLTGRRQALLEFRRGTLATGDPLRLYRRAINLAVAACILFFLVAGAVLFYRGLQYDQIATTYEAQLGAEFKQHFPGMNVPFNVRAVVTSERRKLTDQGALALPPEVRESALRVMRDVLAGVDAAAPITFERMTFDDTSVTLAGNARSAQDLTPIINAAKAAGLDVALPQTSRASDNSITFTFRAARLRSPTADASTR